MKRTLFALVIALLFAACPSTNQPPANPPAGCVLDLPATSEITTPEVAENVLLSVTKIVRDTVRAVDAAPRLTPRDEQIHASVKRAEEQFKVQARRVLPLIETWKQLRNPESRAAWEKAWADLIVKALQVIATRSGGGGSAEVAYPAPVKNGV